MLRSLYISACLVVGLLMPLCALSQSNETATSGQRTPINLLFIGDMMQHDAQIASAYVSSTDSYNYAPYFEHIGSISKQADIAICNFEVTLAGKPYKGYPSFSAPDEYLKAIIDAGYDVFTTANNHCLDKGQKGIERTIALMRDAQVHQLGTYEDSLDRSLRYPKLYHCNGWRIVFLNYTYGTNGLKPTAGNVVNYISKAQIAKDIAKAKALNPDRIIAIVHWGIERAHTPNTDQKSLAQWLIAQGVDHIIGHHPHCPQPAEVITTADGAQHVVFYSLGNVISNMSKDDTEGGLIAGLTLEDNYNQTAATAWWTPFKTANPNVTTVPAYTAFPLGIDPRHVPDDEQTRLSDFISRTRDVMKQGTYLTEKDCNNWGW